VAVVIVALAGIIVMDTFVESHRYNLVAVIALVPIGLSPFFLMCLSYKYDSPYMAFSVLAAVLPIAFTDKTKWKYTVLVAACTVAMCLTYQAASGIFPMLVLFVAFHMWNKAETIMAIIRIVGRSAVGYIAGILLFRFVIM